MALRLEVGKTYLDGYNRKVRIVDDKFKPKPYLGILDLNGPHDGICGYTKDGSYEAKYDGNLNLVSEFKEPTYKYFNLYKEVAPMRSDQLGHLKETLTGAIQVANLYDAIATYRIDLNTGDITKLNI